ncbi:MAG: hypothetical protein KZQ66_14025, partial [Candidatus Thiodiazotropha sp. (ex Lucinoma aequizonata)]|nr:hypothetical protein [Candidatus Thiodiazotropha sp. (ex Lucinoma aequizonata)]MCU7896740.1 hypothetical protein [Candidatus Thiodiazotropha sp. (ex Lucinoma aequizonata)]MCU7902973.1 hypothetical protein [Candidatus Thiodiazotropha sp. (ex Lucinoma aequizonata)]
MFLVTQTKNGISALELMRHLGVSYGTAWSIKHKLMQVMKEREDGQLLDGIIQMDNAYWRVTIQPILPWPTRLGLMHLHEIRFFALKKQ